MATQDLGIIMPVPRGDWNSSISYNTLNIVKYNNATYMAKQNSLAVPPSSSEAYWMKLVDNQTPPVQSTKAIGEIVMLTSNDNPHDLYGGNWLQIKGVFLYAAEDSGDYVNGAIGGSKDTVLVVHTHAATTTTNIVYASETGGETGSAAMGLLQTNSVGFNHCYHWASTTAIANAGESGIGKNMPPYLCVNIWQRIS